MSSQFGLNCAQARACYEQAVAGAIFMFKHTQDNDECNWVREALSDICEEVSERVLVAHKLLSGRGWLSAWA